MPPHAPTPMPWPPHIPCPLMPHDTTRHDTTHHDTTRYHTRRHDTILYYRHLSASIMCPHVQICTLHFICAIHAILLAWPLWMQAAAVSGSSVLCATETDHLMRLDTRCSVSVWSVPVSFVTLSSVPIWVRSSRLSISLTCHVTFLSLHSSTSS